jgi:hypothetical protein
LLEVDKWKVSRVPGYPSSNVACVGRHGDLTTIYAASLRDSLRQLEHILKRNETQRSDTPTMTHERQVMNSAQTIFFERR